MVEITRHSRATYLLTYKDMALERTKVETEERVKGRITKYIYCYWSHSSQAEIDLCEPTRTPSHPAFL